MPAEYDFDRQSVQFDLLLSVRRINADLLLGRTDSLILYETVDLSKKSVVRSDSDIVTGMDLRAALPYDDVACDYALTVALLSSESLGLGLTTVLGGTHSLLMSEEL